MNTFTQQITSAQTIVLNPSDGVVSISVQAAPGGGVFNFLGTYQFQGLTPSNLVLTDGQGVTLTSPSTSSPLSGIIVEWVSGTIEVVIAVS